MCLSVCVYLMCNMHGFYYLSIHSFTDRVHNQVLCTTLRKGYYNHHCLSGGGRQMVIRGDRPEEKTSYPYKMSITSLKSILRLGTSLNQQCQWCGKTPAHNSDVAG